MSIARFNVGVARMARKAEETIFQQSGGAFLRPDDVGSSIQWYVNLGRRFGYDDPSKTYPRFNGCINLTDCTRSIKWSLDQPEDVNKLNLAITELQAAKAALVAARSELERVWPDYDGDVY